MTDLNIPVSSKALYKAYVAWRDCKEGDRHWPDKTQYGLCDWTRWSGLRGGRELSHQFHLGGRGTSYPFGGFAVYRNELRAGHMHLNPERIKWVNDRIADYERHHGLS